MAIDKVRISKKIKSLELQIKSMTSEIEEKWKIRDRLEKDLFNVWREKEGLKPCVFEKEGEQNE